MQPKVSIIIPVYNSEKYLEDCLDSVTGQSLEEIEIFCVNNGSTDSSLLILESYAKKDSRVTVINLPEADVGKARNTGIRAAGGEYLMFVDSDDWIEKEACATLYSVAQKHDLDMLQGLFRIVPGPEPLHSKCKKNLYGKIISGINFWKENTELTLGMWDKIWKRKFFIENNLFNPEGIFYEDIMTNLRGYILGKSFMMMNYRFYNYRTVPTSISNFPSTEQHIQSQQIVNNQIENFINHYNLWNETQPMVLYLKTNFIYYTCFNRKEIYELRIIKKKVSKNILCSCPLTVKLAYHAPLLASVIYPIWSKRRVFMLYLNRLFK